MRLGIDSYSYHRLFGQLRPGEVPAPRAFADGALDPIREARRLGADLASLETCYLPRPREVDLGAIRAAAGPLEVMFAWGHPVGIAFGTQPEMLDDLLEWVELARRAGHPLLRMVLGGPPLFRARPVEEQIAGSIEPLRRACEAGVHLAIENHGDLRAAELREVIERVDRPEVGVCFDTANAPRTGDEVVEATRILAPYIRMVHLKDIEPVENAAEFIGGPRSVPYGEGVIPIEEVLDVLAEAGFDGPVCVEIAQLGPDDDEIELVERCMDWLRERLPS